MSSAAKTIGALASPITMGISLMKDMLTPNLPDAPDAPTVTRPKSMPTPDDEEVRRARRRSLTDQLQRRGRASTILTNDDALGG